MFKLIFSTKFYSFQPIYFQLVGLLILILACVVISEVQRPKILHINIVIVVFILFMAALGALLHFASVKSTADEYDVEKQTKGEHWFCRLYVII